MVKKYLSHFFQRYRWWLNATENSINNLRILPWLFSQDLNAFNNCFKRFDGDLKARLSTS